MSPSLTPTQQGQAGRARDLAAALTAPVDDLAGHIKLPVPQDITGVAGVYGQACGHAAATIRDLLAIIDGITGGQS
ncbi:MAG TPA: hypothetical protein VH641_14435 [Streptosporangiaceae bacterium]|jgi:hypothetical protein